MSSDAATIPVHTDFEQFSAYNFPRLCSTTSATTCPTPWLGATGGQRDEIILRRKTGPLPSPIAGHRSDRLSLFFFLLLPLGEPRARLRMEGGREDRGRTESGRPYSRTPPL